MRQRGAVRPEAFIVVLAVVVFILAMASLFSGPSHERHHVKIYKLKNHHVLMQDDKGRFFKYVVNNADIDFDIPMSSSGRFSIPTGGSWRPATVEEEEEVIAEAADLEDAEENATVSEGDDGAPDAGADTGSDSGDSGGDGGDDGGE